MRVDAVRGERVLVGDRFVPATVLIRDGRIDASRTDTRFSRSPRLVERLMVRWRRGGVR